MIFMNLILASASPRRQSLLSQLGIDFAIIPADIDETPRPAESAPDYVMRLARQKAAAVFAELPASQRASTWVLGSDTSVVLNDEILGKPQDRAHALEMLSRLSGRTHQVMTSVVVQGPQHTQRHLSVTEVTFIALTERDKSLYWDSGEPHDKAGAYGIQGLGGRFISHMVGDFHGVVGLPLAATAELLQQAGFVIWPQGLAKTESMTGVQA